MFKKIIEYTNKNSILCLYPNITFNNYKYVTQKFTVEEANRIKARLKKTYKDITITSLRQTETFHKNLIKVQYTNQIHFIKKENMHVIFDNNLLMITNITQLDESQYPVLSQYDHVCIKDTEIHKVGNIEILFVSCNEQVTVYMDVSNMKQTDEKLFDLLMAVLH